MIISDKNISMGNIRDVLGYTGFITLSQLCTSGNLNVWARYRPRKDLPYFNRIYRLIDILNTDWGHFQTLQDSGPYRLGDFKNYNHQAANPIDTIALTYNKNNRTLHVEFDRTDEEFSWQYSEIGYYREAPENLHNFYFGILFTKENDPVIHSYTFNTPWIQEGEIENVTLVNGVYSCYPILSDHVLYDGANPSGFFVKLPINIEDLEVKSAYEGTAVYTSSVEVTDIITNMQYVTLDWCLRNKGDENRTVTIKAYILGSPKDDNQPKDVQYFYNGTVLDKVTIPKNKEVCVQSEQNFTFHPDLYNYSLYTCIYDPIDTIDFICEQQDININICTYIWGSQEIVMIKDSNGYIIYDNTITILASDIEDDNAQILWRVYIDKKCGDNIISDIDYVEFWTYDWHIYKNTTNDQVNMCFKRYSIKPTNSYGITSLITLDQCVPQYGANQDVIDPKNLEYEVSGTYNKTYKTFAICYKITNPFNKAVTISDLWAEYDFIGYDRPVDLKDSITVYPGSPINDCTNIYNINSIPSTVDKVRLYIGNDTLVASNTIKVEGEIVGPEPKVEYEWGTITAVGFYTTEKGNIRVYSLSANDSGTIYARWTLAVEEWLDGEPTRTVETITYNHKVEYSPNYNSSSMFYCRDPLVNPSSSQYPVSESTRLPQQCIEQAAYQEGKPDVRYEFGGVIYVNYTTIGYEGGDRDIIITIERKKYVNNDLVDTDSVSYRKEGVHFDANTSSESKTISKDIVISDADAQKLGVSSGKTFTLQFTQNGKPQTINPTDSSIEYTLDVSIQFYKNNLYVYLAINNTSGNTLIINNPQIQLCNVELCNSYSFNNGNAITVDSNSIEYISYNSKGNIVLNNNDLGNIIKVCICDGDTELVCASQDDFLDEGEYV